MEASPEVVVPNESALGKVNLSSICFADVWAGAGVETVVVGISAHR